MKLGIRLTPGDISAFKCLISLAVLYATISALVYSILHMSHITPLDADAPPDRFSEARAIQHIRVLTEEIASRQEGSPGLKEAAGYIKSQLETMAMRAGSNVRIDIEETVVNGSFNMVFLQHSISFAYRNHTNILMRYHLIRMGFDGPGKLCLLQRWF